MSRLAVLIVDDEPYVRASLVALLSAEGFDSEAAASVDEALRRLEQRAFDVVVSDLSMPKHSGLDLVRETRRAASAVPVVLVTGVGGVPEAVAAMKSGAFDFLQKPVDPEQLGVVVRRAAEHGALAAEVRHLRARVLDIEGSAGFVGRSAAMAHVRDAIEQIAPRSVPVLVTGEPGTGRHLAAFEIHRRGDRARGPLVRILGDDCEGGSNPLARARGGTLVLDGVERVPMAHQARWVEWLAASPRPERGSDARVVALSSADLDLELRAGRVRADLVDALALLRLSLPPLRRHVEDLPEIVGHLLGTREPQPLPAECLEVLASHDWPGNVRELANVLERARIVRGTAPIDAEVLRAILESASATPAASNTREFHLRSNLDLREKQLIESALERSRGRKREASDLLGIDARNLGYYLKKHKLHGPWPATEG